MASSLDKMNHDPHPLTHLRAVLHCRFEPSPAAWDQQRAAESRAEGNKGEGGDTVIREKNKQQPARVQDT